MTVLQATTKTAILTYSCPQLFSIPQPIEAYDIENMFEIEDNDQAEAEATIDGFIQAYIKAIVLKGKIHLVAGSPSYLVLQKVMLDQYRAGIVFPGTLNVFLPSLSKDVNYTDFIILSSFKGYDLEKKVKKVTISFACTPPDESLLSQDIQAALAGINLVAGL